MHLSTQAAGKIRLFDKIGQPFDNLNNVKLTTFVFHCNNPAFLEHLLLAFTMLPTVARLAQSVSAKPLNLHETSAMLLPPLPSVP